mgnify:CR=1 FL=1
MKIRFFNTYEPVSAFYRDLIPHLATADLVTGDLEIEIVVSKTEYRKRADLTDLFGPFTNVTVTKTPNLGLHAHQGTVAKAIVTLLYTVWAASYALFGPRVDVNVFLSQPPMIPLLGYLLAFLRRQPYFSVVMDVQPQISIALGLVKETNLLVRVFKYLSLAAWKKAAGVIVIGRCMQGKLIQLGVPPENVHFIANWANEDEIKPISAENNRLIAEHGWANKFVVLYAGNIGIPQYFDDILEIAKRLESEQNLLFAFIGGGARKNVIEEHIIKNSLSNIEILPFLQHQYSLSEILSAGNVHFVALKDNLVGLAVPSKAYGIMAAGRSFIYQGHPEGEIARVIIEEDIGTVINCGDVDALEQSILIRLNEQGLVNTQSNKARALAEGNSCKQASLETYTSLLTSYRLGNTNTAKIRHEI